MVEVLGEGQGSQQLLLLLPLLWSAGEEEDDDDDGAGALGLSIVEVRERKTRGSKIDVDKRE